MELAITKDDMAIHYELKGKGYPLVMIHGQFQNTTVFDGFEKAFIKDYQLIKIDLRGHGFSDKPMEIKMDDYIQDVLTVLNKLYIQEAAFIGIGLGGMVAELIAARYPSTVRKLVLVSTGTEPYHVSEKKFHLKYSNLLRTLDRKGRNQLLKSYMYKNIKAADKYEKRMKDTESGMTEHESYAVIHSTDGFDPRYELNKIKCETLIISGQHDEMIPLPHAEVIHESIENSRLSVYTESGHAPYAEEHDKFMNEVKEFIALN